MKIIDLLNKIANGEEVPKKIKYKNKIYEWKEYDVCYGKIMTKKGWVKEHGYVAEENRTYFYLKHCYQDLNDEVEIIKEEPYVEICGRWFTKSEYNEFVKDEEEKKIPEKIIPTSLKGIDNLDEKIEIAHIDTVSVIETLNQVIDYLKSKGE